MNQLQESKIINNKLCVTIQKIADIYGVTVRQIDRWVDYKDCPKEDKHYFSIDDVKVWYDKSGLREKKEIREGRIPVTAPETETPGKQLSHAQSKIKYDAEYKRLMSEKLELENSIKRGDFISKSDIQEILTQIMAQQKRSLNSLSRTISIYVSPFVDAVTARKIGHDVDEIIKDFERQVANGLEYDAPNIKRRK